VPDRPLAAMVFQEHSLFPWMTVEENAGFGLEMRNVPRKEREARVMALLETVGLAKYRRHYPNQLSGGMKQRISLVRAFVTAPQCCWWTNLSPRSTRRPRSSFRKS
jgi:NitT/TauT family transport system ATP-binding protein